MSGLFLLFDRRTLPSKRHLIVEDQTFRYKQYTNLTPSKTMVRIKHDSKCGRFLLCFLILLQQVFFLYRHL